MERQNLTYHNTLNSIYYELDRLYSVYMEESVALSLLREVAGKFGYELVEKQ